MREIVNEDDPDVAEYDENQHIVKITVGEDMSVTVKYDGLNTPPTFRNTLREYRLPNTGGIGIVPFIIFGGAMISGSVILLIRRRRREAG